MKSLFLVLAAILLVLSPTTAQQHSVLTNFDKNPNPRRILHQPLFPATSAPPPGSQPPPPPPDSSVFPNPDRPFFPEVPAGPTPDETQQSSPPSVPTNGTIPIAEAAQPGKPVKKFAIAISVGIVTLGMLSALAFFLYRHRVKHPGGTQKLVGSNNSQSFTDESRAPPSSFLYIGTVEPVRSSFTEANGTNGANGSPNKINSVKKSNRYRPSPDLQPLPPLPKPPSPPLVENNNSSSSLSPSSDEESHGTAFYTPQSSSISTISNDSNHDQMVVSNGSSSVPHSKRTSPPHSRRTSPKSRFSVSSSPEMKHVIIPSIKQPVPLPPPPPPPPPPAVTPTQAVAPAQSQGSTEQDSQQTIPYSKPKFAPPPPNMAALRSLHNLSPQIPSIKQPVPPPPPQAVPPAQPQGSTEQDSPQTIPYSKPKFASRPPPPPPNMAALRSLHNQSPQKPKTPVPPPAPPPPPPPAAAMSTLWKVGETSVSSMPKKVLTKPSWTPSPRAASTTESTKSVEEDNKSASSSERIDADDNDGAKPKLKPLHWDKVRATSDRATVWDQLRSSSFQLNEDMMETLFGCNSTNPIPKEATRKSVLPPVEQENRVLDPKKSQNIAILLRALNVTRDEVAEALLDGNPESLGAELLETLVKMAPTKEEEIKLREYSGDISKLGSAERFLKTVLDIPFAFKRVEAMLYRANFDSEVKYLRKSFQTLEAASDELKNSHLFLKLLEAVLQTGNRMNVGTNRGDAKAFKLDTLLKLVDIKGTDGKTTLLHFVVQEIIRSEGASTNTTNENTVSRMKEDDFRKQGLQVVAGLSRDLSNVKKAAGMDSDVLGSYVSKLETGLEKIQRVFQPDKPEMQGNFFSSMKMFLRESDAEISRIKADERKALAHVKEVTEYFHGDTAKEEAHPLRIFMIVKDFLNILDHVCKEVGNMQDRTMVGSARSFRISSTASLPVLSRYNKVRQDRSSDEESSSP